MPDVDFSSQMAMNIGAAAVGGLVRQVVKQHHVSAIAVSVFGLPACAHWRLPRVLVAVFVRFTACSIFSKPLDHLMCVCPYVVFFSSIQEENKFQSGDEGIRRYLGVAVFHATRVLVAKREKLSERGGGNKALFWRRRVPCHTQLGGQEEKLSERG